VPSQFSRLRSPEPLSHENRIALVHCGTQDRATNSHDYVRDMKKRPDTPWEGDRASKSGSFLSHRRGHRTEDSHAAALAKDHVNSNCAGAVPDLRYSHISQCLPMIGKRLPRCFKTGCPRWQACAACVSLAASADMTMDRLVKTKVTQPRMRYLVTPPSPSSPDSPGSAGSRSCLSAASRATASPGRIRPSGRAARAPVAPAGG
jgi:hypothetical protein